MKQFTLFTILLAACTCYTPSYSKSSKSFFSSFKNAINSWYSEPDEAEVKTKTIELNHHSTLDIEVTHGSLNITSWNQPKLLLEVSKKTKNAQLSEFAVEVTTKPHYAHINALTSENKDAKALTTDLRIVVPHSTSLNIMTQKGKIKIENISGTISATTEDGNISIVHAQNTVQAKAPAGKIKIKQYALEEQHSLFLEAHNGVTLFLNPMLNAHIHARTAQGIITSSMQLSLDPLTTTLGQGYWERVKKQVNATLGDGGAPITIEVTQGSIELLEY